MMSLPQPKVVKKKVSELTKAPTNIRLEYPDDKMDLLRKSIRSLGLLELPKATPDGEVFAGWGRVEACSAEGIEDIWVIEVSSFSEREQMLASLAENYARANLEDDELRYVLKRLYDEGLTVPEIAKVTGVNAGTIYSILSFYNLPENVQEKVGESITQLPRYSIPHITKAVEAVPDADKVLVAEKMVGIATSKHPSGKPVAQTTLHHIAEQAKMGKPNMPSILDQVMEQVSKVEYMIITISIPEDLYAPWLKLARLENKTFQEKVLEHLRDNLSDIKKKLSQLSP